MGDRTYGRDGRAPAPRRTTDFDGRRRHDQQRLLVELELDDSLYQGTLQAGIEQRAAWYSAPDRISAFAGDSRHLQHGDYIAEPKTRVQSRNSRDPTAKPLTERQMQQLNAKRLSSPYKLKQQVLDIRNDSTSHRISHEQSSQRGSGGSGTRRSIRSPTLQRSPAHLVMESIRQNMHLRDQVLAHLQQELMGVLPLHRASHVEKNVPQRVVKLLNRMRSLSLAVVEAVVYLSGELGDSNIVGQSVEHEVLEQDFFGYLLQMASDSDFLACSPQLQRFFEVFEVNLTRNPFVDGLSLDSSEVLLCSCHQSAESGVLFCSAASSPSSLLRLLRQKLETFALQTQRYLPGWQIIPAERVAAALLHLTDLETRFNAVRMIPRYLQSKIDSKRYSDQHRGPDNTSYGYGTFEDERIPRLDRQDSQASRSSDYGIPHGISVVEAWAGSPIPKAPVVYESRVLPSSASKQNAPDQHSSSKASNDSARGLAKKEENARRSSSAWIPMPISTEPISARTAIPAEADSAGNGGSDKVEVTRLVLPPTLLDISAVAKSSSRSSESERAAAKRRSSKATEKTHIRKALIDSGTQMTRSVRDEAMQVYQDESASLVSERRPPVRSVREDGCKAETCEVNPATKSVEDELSESVASLELDGSVSSSELEALYASSCSELDFSRGIAEGEPSGVVDVVDRELDANAEAVADLDDEYDCDFEYSSNEALSSIAVALRMLPNFTLPTTDSTLDDEVLKPEVAIPPNDYESVVSSRTEENAEFTESIAVPDASAAMSSVGVPPASTGRSVLSEVTTSTENVITELESVEQRVEPEDDEYSYTSSTAISNIAMALSILPSAWRDNAFVVAEERHKDQSETVMDIDSSRLSTYRSLEDTHPSLDELRHFDIDALSGSPCSIRATVSEQAAQFSPSSSHSSIPPTFDSNISVSLSDKTVNFSPSSSQSNVSDKARDQDLPSSRTCSSVRSDTTEQATPASSRSNISAAYSYQADDESEPSELNRIFALCRNIQVAAYDMNHWVSQREVEDHIQSSAQPFSALMGYSSPTATIVVVDSAPKYLERELKMLRRNFASWRVFCMEQKRAKVVVRRLVARRKVRQFVSHHYQRQLQARIDEDNRLRSLAASRIQRCWRVHRQNREILQRKAVFRAVDLAFRRTKFFMSISKRRRVRECAKEKLVRWWRRQRSRIKKTKQREEKLVREKERRARALKDIRRFLKEILLRRKLKDAQERAKNILFKEQLKWTKAKRDVERSMKINSKHRRELIADMNARLADLDRRWKASEEERLQLLTHHERVVQQQQQAVEVRRRRLAALKIQMFFRVCCLHKKLHSVESEKKKYETQLQEELLAKKKLGVEAQRRVGKTRTQVRVLERKLGRMSQQALQTDAQHREVVQAHQERERLSQERAARQKIKAFVDARVLLRRAERERYQLLLQQAYLQAEKTEIELMSSEDQLEQRRAAASVASDLQQRLSELEARSEALLVAKSKLEAEKEQEARRAVAALEHSRVEASMQQIASWVSGQMQLSKLKKEQAAIRESAAHEMEEEKRRQRKEIGAMLREITSIKDSSFMHQRVSQYRNRRTVEMMRIQQQQKATYEKAVAERTRAQLVQVIITVKLLSESESSKGVAQAFDGVTNFHKTLKHKWMRLKYLRRMNSVRTIQRSWRREQVKRVEQLALAQLKLTERRQALARQIQAWWRQWIQQRRQEQEVVLQAHLEGIRVRANARKIQRAWRCWIVCERERRIQQQLAFEAHLEAIHIRVNVRKTQGAWRRWMEAERERRIQQKRVFEAHLYSIRARSKVRKIQGVWRRWIVCEQERRRQRQLAFQAHLEAIRVEARHRWVQHEQERRYQQQAAFDAHLQPIRVRAYARKIQATWRRWVAREKERRKQQKLALQAHLEAIRVRAHVRKIQGFWRRWIAYERERRRGQQFVFQAHLDIIRLRANVRRIQGAWRRWVQTEHERRREQQAAFVAHLDAIRARANVRKIQAAWRRWGMHERQRRREQNLVYQAHLEAIRVRAYARKIQGAWRYWVRCEQERRCGQQLAFETLLGAIRVRANVRKIQALWRRWVTSERDRRQYQQSVFGAHLEVIRTRSVVRKIQSAWRRWVTRERARRQQQRLVFNAHLEVIRVRAHVRKIQGVWRRWIQQERERRRQQELALSTHLEAIRARANVRKIQGAWRRWIRSEQERRHQQQLVFIAHLEAIRLRANVRKIQGVWRRWVQSKQEERERRRVQQLVFSSAIRIQRRWRKWQKLQREKAERIRILRNASAQVIQRKWESWQQWKFAEREKTRLRTLQQACARKLQNLWKMWCQWKCMRERSARRIQERWKWQKQKTRKRRIQQMSSAKIQSACYQWWRKKQRQRQTLQSVLRIQRAWRRWHQRSVEKEERERQEKEERAVALRIQQNWTKKRLGRNREEERRAKAYAEEEARRTSAMLLQRVWKKWHVAKCDRNELKRLRQERERQASVKLGTEQSLQKEDERLLQALALKTQKDQQELERVQQTQNASSLKIQRNWGIRQHRRKMEHERIQHEQDMSALKIQTLWLRWHHEQKEELEREFIRQEQYESSVKSQRHWGLSQQKRKLAEERLRHKQSISALKIQKHWRRWHYLRLEQLKRSKSEGAKAQMSTTSSTVECNYDPKETQRPQREQKLDIIAHRSNGRRIARAVKRYLQSRRQDSAATKIEAMWKAKLYRVHYLQSLEAQRAEEIRAYRLALSVLATKVQVCWRQWHSGIRRAKRAAVKDDELRLIQESKALERKILVLRHSLAAKRIQRALASRRRLQDITYVSQKEVKRKEAVEETTDKPLSDEPTDDQPQSEKPAGDYQEPVETAEEDFTRASVQMTVDNWSHRELPHILTRSMNQIMFFHDVATVLQKYIRDYQRRQQLHFYFQRSPDGALSSEQGDIDGDATAGHFHFYFKRASAWLEWGGLQSISYADSRLDTNQDNTLLRLRFDSQMTRRLLQLSEPSEEYTLLETQQVLQEIVTDALPIFHSPVCVQDHENVRPELRYHDVEEMELPGSVKLLRQMAQHRAHIRRQQLLEIDTSFSQPSVSLPSPVAKSVPSSPIGKSAPSSPSQRAKKEVTIFTAVENASVDDITFIQRRGADLAAVEPKMQRNALHMLSFSKENYRARAELLEFLLSCDAKLDVNAVDCNGDTPLMLYASSGHLEFMQKLLEHGADILKTNRKGQNVLHRACEDDQVEICGFLQQLMTKDSIAENIIPIETVSTLAPPTLSLHIPDSTGRYPMHCVAEKGFVECAKQLVVPTEANYEWNRMLQAQGDSQGRTALHLAVLTHDAAMTAFLLTPGGGSNVNAFDDLHRSPLHYAVESPAALPIIARLVQHGATVNVVDERGDTPLHWAAFSGRAAVAQNLLTLGADPTLVNSDWETPAQIAAAYGQLDCMRLLLQAQRRYGAAASSDPKEPTLTRPASEKTALQRLEEAVNHLHQRQDSAHSYRDADQDTGLATASTNDALDAEHETTEQSHAGYWEELHQDVQLVEESGHFSSEDEEDLLFGRDGDGDGDDDLNF